MNIRVDQKTDQVVIKLTKGETSDLASSISIARCLVTHTVGNVCVKASAAHDALTALCAALAEEVETVLEPMV